MVDEESVVSVLKELSKLDGAIGRILGEKNRFLSKSQEARKEYDTINTRLNDVESEYNALLSRYKSEEDWVKVERDKIKDRRKAVATFSNYKVQENVQNEINRNEQVISAREDSMLLLVEQVEKMETLLNEAKEKAQIAKNDLDEIDSNSQSVLTEFEEKYSEKRKIHEKLSTQLPVDVLAIYTQVKTKYDIDAVVEVNGNNCGACYMSVTPLQTVHLLEGNQIVRCRGCKRILLPSSEPSET